MQASYAETTTPVRPSIVELASASRRCSVSATSRRAPTRPEKHQEVAESSRGGVGSRATLSRKCVSAFTRPWTRRSPDAARKDGRKRTCGRLLA
jgi:hypothetical protein